MDRGRTWIARSPVAGRARGADRTAWPGASSVRPKAPDGYAVARGWFAPRDTEEIVVTWGSPATAVQRIVTEIDGLAAIRAELPITPGSGPGGATRCVGMWRGR